LITLDSIFRRNNRKKVFSTFCETIKPNCFNTTRLWEKCQIGGLNAKPPARPFPETCPPGTGLKALASTPGMLHHPSSGSRSPRETATPLTTTKTCFPGNVSTSAKYYKISAAGGWQEIPFGSNDGDNTITITLTDGDPLTDADGLRDGRILDPGALALPAAAGGGGCFISTLNAGR
jgi:hypothetical protein